MNELQKKQFAQLHRAYKQDLLERVRKVTCPLCGAKPQQRCRGRTHGARIDGWAHVTPPGMTRPSEKASSWAVATGTPTQLRLGADLFDHSCLGGIHGEVYIMIVVHKYGLLAPTMHAEEVRELLRMGHRFRNQLTEIERARRQALRDLEARGVQWYERVLDVAERRLLRAVAAVKRTRAVSRSRFSETAAMRERVVLLRQVRNICRLALAIARSQYRQTVREERAIIETRENDLRKGLRALYPRGTWGTRGIQENAHDVARKAPLYDGVEPHDPRFLRFTGEGQIGVQLQGGLPVVEAFGEDSQLRIIRIPDRNVARGRRDFAILRMRINSEPDGSPIFADFPMRFHREFPANATIKVVTVNLRRIGPREEWYVCFTVDTTCSPRRESCGSGVVAVDLGWRLLPDGGIRVAVAGDQPLVLTPHQIGGLRRAETLRSTRDMEFNVARQVLVRWMRSMEAVPEWLLLRTVRRGTPTPSVAQAAAYFDGWHSQARLASLVRYWRDHRFTGDVGTYEALEAWRYQDFHLWQWESSQRSGAIRNRKNVFRVWAAQLARQYDTLLLEAFDLREVAARPDVLDPGENETARSNRQLVAVSEFRSTLIQAFGSRGGQIRIVDAADTTRTNPITGEVADWGAEKSILLSDDQGNTWDQDIGAAQVMMARHEAGRSQTLDQYREGRRAARTSATARNSQSGANVPQNEGRWARVRRLRAEREAQEGTARNAMDNPAE